MSSAKAAAADYHRGGWCPIPIKKASKVRARMGADRPRTEQRRFTVAEAAERRHARTRRRRVASRARGALEGA